MKAGEVQILACYAMGSTPGTWEADASGNVLCDGAMVYAAQPGVPDWQAKANGETLARLMNAKAEVIYLLEKLPAVIARQRAVAPVELAAAA